MTSLDDMKRELRTKYENLRQTGGKLPPFPEVHKKRTDYGYCLSMALGIGEWQNKVYWAAQIGDWLSAIGNARGVVIFEKELQMFCGVDTTRAQYYAQKLVEAAEKRSFRLVDHAISEHDPEIVAALETAEWRV